MPQPVYKSIQNIYEVLEEIFLSIALCHLLASLKRSLCAERPGVSEQNTFLLTLTLI